ncbi:MAG: hypothetical protein WBP59_02950 [Ilumatobacteraceae bacterium]
MHPLHQVMIDAAAGRFPAIDGRAETHRPEPGGHHGVFEFTGHAHVLSNGAPEEVLERGADGFGGASHPDLLRWLAGPDGWIGSHDAVLVTRGRGGGNLPERADLEDHPRVVRARRHRRNVRVHGDTTGVVTLGNGLVDRLEMSVELFDPSASGQGAGGALISEAIALVPAGTLVWAQVAPGNAASLRAFLRLGFRPIGAETLLMPAGTGTADAPS